MRVEIKDPLKVAHLIKIARELADILNQISAHPSYKGVFGLAQTHGMGYSGPQYGIKLQELEAVLKEIE